MIAFNDCDHSRIRSPHSRLLEPLMRIRFIVEGLDFNISALAVQCSLRLSLSSNSGPKNLGEQRDLIEPKDLGKAQHQVHCLHRLAGGPLGQVVERRNHNGASWDTISGNPDESHV